jgi:hypothetical protein
MGFILGHPAYPQSGGNRVELVSNPHLAVLKLTDRGANPQEARRAVEDASKGWFAAVYVHGGDICEVVKKCI